jgi:hypothetical protein
MSLNTVYMGSLYGKLVTGKMVWDKTGNAEVSVSFNVDGGTQTWAGAKGYGTFVGTLSASTKEEATLIGTLTITYTRPALN